MHDPATVKVSILSTLFLYIVAKIWAKFDYRRIISNCLYALTPTRSEGEYLVSRRGRRSHRTEIVKRQEDIFKRIRSFWAGVDINYCNWELGVRSRLKAVHVRAVGNARAFACIKAMARECQEKDGAANSG
ncbi:hypothetical protein K440DRAFT_622519 [Wilcoxina mikolae CBS 423.85]|nr:hypothetical protein K440DRAFT_622519 [Wilcoxina mikolae CBS 423.85]